MRYMSYICIVKKIGTMIQDRKYHIGRSGSGWGIWDNEGKKVKGCYSHYNAVETLYSLMRWEFNPAKYRK